MYRMRVPFILSVVCFVLFTVAPLAAQSEAVVWKSWSEDDLKALGDDHTGSTFAISTLDGVTALQITPGGSSEETKLAYPLKGSDLQTWVDNGQIEMDVYLPPESALNPNAFFLGVADVTGQWEWVGGLFGSSSGTSGWVTVRYSLGSVIQQANADGDYMLYLSFFNQSGGSKNPLTESFGLGAVRLLSTVTDTPDEASYQSEAEHLLTLNDADLVAAIARETFDYFWMEANPQTGLVKDRSTPDSVASIAATGFGLAAIPIGVERGWIRHIEGYQRARRILQTFVNGGVQGSHGFFFHFIDPASGERVWNSELSSIDTALLVAGALVAGQYFAGTEVQTLADQLYSNVEWDWMRTKDGFIRMGWTPEGGMFDAAWDHFDESMILYALAIGSPTHATAAVAWDLWERTLYRKGGYIYLPGEPLFVYQYPLAFLDLHRREDAYANYWNNTALACQRNLQFALDHSAQFTTYQNGVWGLSASDGPTGYKAYGAAESNHDGTVAPYAAAACLPFTPEIALSGIRAMLTEYGSRVWREYGLVSAINADRDWYSHDHIGIDQGDILLMLTNAQDGLVWKLFMANPSIQAALDAMGFVESTGDYAVTPTYLGG